MSEEFWTMIVGFVSIAGLMITHHGSVNKRLIRIETELLSNLNQRVAFIEGRLGIPANRPDQDGEPSGE